MVRAAMGRGKADGHEARADCVGDGATGPVVDGEVVQDPRQVLGAVGEREAGVGNDGGGVGDEGGEGWPTEVVGRVAVDLGAEQGDGAAGGVRPRAAPRSGLDDPVHAHSVDGAHLDQGVAVEGRQTVVDLGP